MPSLHRRLSKAIPFTLFSDDGDGDSDSEGVNDLGENSAGIIHLPMSSLRRRLSRAIPFALFPDDEDGDSDSEGRINKKVCCCRLVGLLEEEDFEENHRSYLKMLKDGAFTLLRLWTHFLRRVRLFFNPNGVLYSDWEAMALFECWCNKYDKTYPLIQEKLYRVNVFKSSLEWIYRENQKRGQAPVGHNRWDDLTQDELCCRFCLLKSSDYTHTDIDTDTE